MATHPDGIAHQDYVSGAVSEAVGIPVEIKKKRNWETKGANRTRIKRKSRIPFSAVF